MIDLTKYSQNLVESGGMFFTEKESEVSYPESGNDDFYQIEENSFWFRHRNNCIIESVKRHNKNKIFFDVGGGNGFVAKGLQENGFETVLLEPGLQGCLNAKKREIETVICSTFENADFQKGSIENVGVFDVVEHIENDVEFLKEIYSFLEKDGLIYITVPAYNFLWSNDDKYAGHYRRYTVKELENKLKGIGYSIEYSTYIFSILVIPVFFFRTLPSLFNPKKKEKKMDDNKDDHTVKTGIVEKLINKVWQMELKRIKTGRKNRFGGSCFVIAKK